MEEVEKLQHYFTNVLEFPKMEIAESKQKWEEISIITQSLEDHQVFHSQMAADRDAMINGGVWLVAGQLLATETRVPNFVPAKAGNPISMDNFTDQLRKMGYAWI
ncbi:hypothetical protein COCNU_15G004450 [Cocos nucifera]|uniref:Uncharacterized protein n=1 Tax=Cocos nucifera TaxID=13894 RepID=A0A8K0IX18_COCNU|nr:hypothetical protein COCNU_15G004450 [Cocos nucifera]